MDRVVRRKQLLELIGVSSTTQWRMERAGQFPARVRIGKGLVGWHLVEVEKWLEDRERVLRRAPEGGSVPKGSGSIVGSQLGVDSTLPLALSHNTRQDPGGSDE